MHLYDLTCRPCFAVAASTRLLLSAHGGTPDGMTAQCCSRNVATTAVLCLRLYAATMIGQSAFEIRFVHILSAQYLARHVLTGLSCGIH